MELHEIVKAIVGKTKPIGESAYDEYCHTNLEKYGELLQEMVKELISLSDYQDRPEYSVCRIGEFANSILNNILAEIEDAIYSSLCSLVDCESPIEQMMALALDGLLNNASLNINEIRKQEVIQCGTKSYRVDFALHICDPISNKENVVIVECDGHDFHQKTKEQVNRDNKRTRDLTSKGYIVCRFSGSEIFNAPYKCAVEVMNLIKGTSNKEGE